MNDARNIRDALGGPESLLLAGVHWKIRQLRFAEWPDALERLTPPVQKALNHAVDLGAWLTRSGVLKPGERVRLDGGQVMAMLPKLVALFAAAPDALRFMIWLASTCTDQHKEVEKLEADDAILLCVRVLEVNASFFGRKLWPILSAQLSRIPGSAPNSSASGKSTVQSAGPTPSSS